MQVSVYALSLTLNPRQMSTRTSQGEPHWFNESFDAISSAIHWREQRLAFTNETRLRDRTIQIQNPDRQRKNSYTLSRHTFKGLRLDQTNDGMLIQLAFREGNVSRFDGH